MNSEYSEHSPCDFGFKCLETDVAIARDWRGVSDTARQSARQTRRGLATGFM